MKNRFLLIFLVVFPFTALFSQSTLFDESRVSSVYIEIPVDSLSVIMTDVLSDHYFKAMFIYDYGTGRDTLQDVGFRLRGNTSRLSKKKSFKISFNEYVPGRRYQEVKKINLNGEHNDPTMIREKLFYDSWKNAGLVERRTSFVRMYINQAYYGLYTNLEEFNKDWLQNVFGENDGNLYKCTYPADLVYHGTDQQTYKDIQSSATTGGRAYDLQTNETADDYTDLVNLITILDQPANEAFAVQIAQILNVDNFLKAFALDVATGNWDDYMYNKNNYFLYHRADIDKFEFISYDTDNTFGVDWIGRDWATRNCLDWITHSEPRPLAQKILSVPEFEIKYQRYLDTIVREIINSALIFPHIDSLKNLITDAAAADTYRKLDYGYTLSDFLDGFTETVDGHTPYGIKPFLTTRSATIMQQLTITELAEANNTTSAISLFPNPADENITLSTSSSTNDRKCFVQDMLGRNQRSFIFPKNHSDLVLTVSGMSPGIYTLVLVGSNTISSARFVKK
ncbi:MAG: CotH kinase family protein [Lentimicrobiaceae bacterium]|jgi:spore coat protein CotH